MVARQGLGILFLSCFLMAGASCGSGEEKVVNLDLDLPPDWESALDMDALGAVLATPYIGTIRFVFGDSGGRYEDFAYDGHAASVDIGGADDLTIQAVTAGQVIMEGSVSGLESASGSVLVSLEKANGFSAAGSLLYPRQNHSAVMVSGVTYILGGNQTTRVIESVAGSSGSFLSSAYAASLVYPRGEAAVLHDPAGEQLFVFKGASAVEDNLYEIVDMGMGAVAPRVISNTRYNFYALMDTQEICLLGGDDGSSTWFESTLIIDAQNLSETIWTGLGSNIVRDNPICLNNGSKVTCLGGGTNVIEVFNIITGGVDYSLPLLPDIVGFSATLLNNNDIVIVGGLEGVIPNNEIRVFRPYTGEYFILSTGGIFPRYYHAAILLDDNNLLIIGGGSSINSSQSAELLNLTTGESTLLPWRMKVPRIGHTATLLSDGRVLVAGGHATDRTIEVFTPRKK